jgi:hypothetical protein
MGTNYYTITKQCDKCGRNDRIHLGKLSAGWKFCFNLNGEKFYRNIKELKEWLKGKEIVSEYGTPIALATFLSTVETAQEIQEDIIDTVYKDIDGYKFLDCEFC